MRLGSKQDWGWGKEDWGLDQNEIVKDSRGEIGEEKSDCKRGCMRNMQNRMGESANTSDSADERSGLPSVRQAH